MLIILLRTVTTADIIKGNNVAFYVLKYINYVIFPISFQFNFIQNLHKTYKTKIINDGNIIQRTVNQP